MTIPEKDVNLEIYTKFTTESFQLKFCTSKRKDYARMKPFINLELFHVVGKDII
ncbi:14626_t:CDS:2 [Funneliformis mosseae]|uniref:14626_t:CDS:1 n=1 Tax=Funneliformis mosseae TaxID=27381 RepID=A0A9N9AZX9_FUNMO|nr:14626_t:CDS:2 [Funneliformis mosseae]